MKTPTQIFGQKLTRTFCSLSLGGILLASISEAFPSDAWQALSNVGAPSARALNSAPVWTGSEMIIWGGNNDTGRGTGGDLNTGARYNPAANSWTAISTTGAPTARSTHAAVWTGSELIVWGGYGGGVLNTGARYNPTSNTWTRSEERRVGKEC